MGFNVWREVRCNQIQLHDTPLGPLPSAVMHVLMYLCLDSPLHLHFQFVSHLFSYEPWMSSYPPCLVNLFGDQKKWISLLQKSKLLIIVLDHHHLLICLWTVHTAYTTEQEAWVFFELLPGVPQGGKRRWTWTYYIQEWTHRHRKQTYGYQRGKGGGTYLKFGINRYMLPYTK